MSRPFKDDARFYPRHDAKFPSVTTICGVIDKPALVGWGVKCMAEKLLALWKERPEEFSTTAFKQIVKEAKSARFIVSKEATDIGSRAHELTELYDLGREEEFDIEQERKEVRNCFNAYLDFLDEMKWTPRHVELTVYHDRLRYAGTLDRVYSTPDGKRVLLDIKTSKALYPEVDLQLAAYVIAFEHQYNENIDEAWALRLDKAKGKFELRECLDVDDAFKAFRAAHELWMWKRRQGG